LNFDLTTATNSRQFYFVVIRCTIFVSVIRQDFWRRGSV